MKKLFLSLLIQVLQLYSYNSKELDFSLPLHKKKVTFKFITATAITNQNKNVYVYGTMAVN